MPGSLKVSKADARRAMVRHHFAPCATSADAFERLRSVQFDPIAPVGCNHDLVLQARVSDYRVGDWEKLAYEERRVYDGWDKQASLVPFEGWPLRRIFHDWYLQGHRKIFDEHPDAIEAILKEIEARGPLLPKECEFQAQRPEWKGSWHGTSVTKQTLRALWHAGLVMTAGRRKGQHLYDLTERVVPPHLFAQPKLNETDSLCGLVLERHRAVGFVRPNAPYEVWSFSASTAQRKAAIGTLVETGELVAVDLEGVLTHATPGFLSLLDSPSIEPRVTFIAPLDQFMWDRKTIAHLFGFDYVWEIYTPEAKRRWGYYVLPVLYGDDLVARAEFWCRGGILELRRWHTETRELTPGFFAELAPALRRLMAYCSATEVRAEAGIDPVIRDLVAAINRSAGA